MPALLRTTQIQEPSSASVNLTLDTSGNGTFAGTSVMSSPYTMRNKIINGAMVIDQRNAGASVTPTNAAYTIDRWKFYVAQASKFTSQQNAGSVTPPSGFINYLGVTSSSAYTVLTGDYFTLDQLIEGLNTADLNWGSASAQTVTLSFWVRSSLTGVFSGGLYNSASNRSYVFTYNINSANTWEQKTITISGDTTGTWLTTSGIGIGLRFNLGGGSTYQTTANAWTAGNFFATSSSVNVVGTNGATFYITGVQLERGTVATPFEYRNYQQELAMCQRYFQKTYKTDVALGTTGANTGYVEWNWGSLVSYATVSMFLRTTMRAYPTFQSYNVATGAAGGFVYYNGTTSVNGTGTLSGLDLGTDVVTWYMDATGRTNLQFHYTMTAEL